MKNLIILTIIAASISITGCGTSKSGANLRTTEIKTSSQCGMCKTSIENGVRSLPGVKTANLNLSSQILTVKFDSDKITLEKIETKINNLGYDANDKSANLEVYEKLPLCCKKE